MAKKMTFNQACKIAGQLYGSLLQRDSDQAGFDWCVENLTNGTLSVRGLIKAICKSEEYREKFLMNEAPNEVAKKWRKKFLGEATPNKEAIKRMAVSLLESDWRVMMDALFDSEEYLAKHGEDGVPR